MNTILILYTEFMPYNLVVVKSLIAKGCRVYVVLWDTNKKTPYLPPRLEGITYYNRSTFRGADHLFRLVTKLSPDLVWTAGWIDPLYTEVAGMIRSKLHLPVVASTDTQWRGKGQWLNVLTASFRHRSWFSHLFVAGEPQVEYARKLGFRPDQILMHNLSADVDLFHRIMPDTRREQYPRRLLYIGRFSADKGLVHLLKAWEAIPDRKGWRLTLIGNGKEYNKLTGYPDVEILDFMPQEKLVQEMACSGAFILPSVFEPWALVIHEAVCAGLPVLASACCGAASVFIKEGENGYLFTPGNRHSIHRTLETFIGLPEEKWLEMGRKSRDISTKITPEKVAANLLNVLK